MRGPNRPGAFALAVGLGAALLAWIVAVAVISHDPLGFFHYGAITWGKDSGLHFVVQQLLHGSVAAKLRFAAWAVVLVGAVLAARRDLELGVYALAATLLALLPGSVVASMPRYALVAFPAFAGLASLGGRRWTAVLLVAFVALEIVFALETFGVDKLYAP